jgi:hypothetical protein
MHVKQIVRGLNEVEDELRDVKVPKPDTTPSPVHDYGTPKFKPEKSS